MSLRGAQRRGNPFSLQYNITESSTLGEYEKILRIRPKAHLSLPFPAGMRIATPVCALVRNDMQKTGTRQRMQGGGARVLPGKVLANADTRQVSACRCELRSCNRRNGFPSACHCEERSDGTIRSPCSTTSQKAVLWANTKKCYKFAQKRIYRCLSLRGRGLPHQCAHWFAMTCKRRVRVSECKAVGREGKCIDGGSFAWYNVLANADTQQISACHCEERSDVAIRSPCSTASQKAVLWANTKKCYEFAQAAYHKSPGNRGRRRTFPCAGLTFAGFSAIM